MLNTAVFYYESNGNAERGQFLLQIPLQGGYVNEPIEKRFDLLWSLGEPEHWVLANVGGMPRIEYTGDLVQMNRRTTYYPLARRDLLPDLAELGAVVHSLPSLPRDSTGNAVREAANDPGVQQAALMFVRAYGKPWFTPWASTPAFVSLRDLRQRDWRPRGRYAFPIADLVWAALDIHEAVRLAASTKRKDRERLDSILSQRFYDALRATLQRTPEGLQPRFVASPEYGPIGAAWLQLVEALAPGGRGLRACKGCGRFFAVRHNNEKYHSQRCRNRDLVAKWRRDKKGAAR